MLIALHSDETPDGPSAPRWAETLERLGHAVRWVDVRRADIIAQVRDCDGFMWRPSQRHGQAEHARKLLPVLEHELGLAVYPDQPTGWHFDDKIAQAYLFEALGIPSPQTWVFYDRAAAEEFAATATYPLVLKLAAGAAGENVALVKSLAAARTWIDRLFGPGLLDFSARWIRRATGRLWLRNMWTALQGRTPPPPRSRWSIHKNYVLFQEFVPGNDGDLRVSVIGNRAFAFRRGNRPGDFRASGAGRVDWDPAGIPLDAVNCALDWTRTLQAQSVAYDMLRSVNGWVTVEISYAFVSHAVHQCPGHWERGADGTLRWIGGQMWPEEAQALDFAARLAARATVRQAARSALDAHAPSRTPSARRTTSVMLPTG